MKKFTSYAKWMMLGIIFFIVLGFIAKSYQLEETGLCFIIAIGMFVGLTQAPEHELIKED